MIRRRQDLLVGPRERAIEAVKAGRKEEAIRHIEDLYEDFRPLHDRYAEWVQSLLSFVAEKLGEEAVEEALRRIVVDVYEDRWASMFRDASAEEIAKMFCRAMRTHYSDFYVEEDDETFVVVTTCCGSGGRLHKEGKAKTTQKAYTWSYGQEGVDYYCCHESVFNLVFQELGLCTVEFGYCKQVDEERKQIGMVCRRTIHKKKVNAGIY